MVYIILLVDKQPGLIVHSDDSEEVNTLIGHIKAYLYRKGEYDPASEQSFAPALCNRIDRNTGGIVIAAKNAASLRVMNEKIRADDLSKYYLCAVHGHMDKSADTLTGYLKKDSDNNIVNITREARPGYKQIVTKYRVVAERNGLSLLEVELVTGRTHQIRVHLAWLGHPVLGDALYGGARCAVTGAGRQMLHARHLALPHPLTGEQLEFTAPVPDDFQSLLDRMG